MASLQAIKMILLLASPLLVLVPDFGKKCNKYFYRNFKEEVCEHDKAIQCKGACQLCMVSCELPGN